MNICLVVILSALGLFLGMANPLYQLPPLALLYPAGLVWIGHTAAGRASAFRLGWITGLLGATGVLYWVAVPVHNIGMLPWIPAIACAMAIAAYVGLYGGLFALLAHAVRKESLWMRALWCGLGWYALEWFRGWFLTGFPWMPLAGAFAPWPTAVQGAAVVGVYALGGLLAAKCAIVVYAGMERRPGPVLLTIAAATALTAGGHWRYTAPLPDGPKLDMILVQGNVDQNVKWVPELQRATVQRYMDITEAALARFRRGAEQAAPNAVPAPLPPAVLPASGTVPVLVVWPETAMPFDFEKAPLAAVVRDFAARENVSLLTGSVGFNSAAEKVLNRAYLVEPGGQAVRWYEKEHLVPFGEYLPPGLDFAFLAPLLQGVGDFVTGTRTAPLPLTLPFAPTAEATLNNALVPGVLICYETIFPELARQRVAEGANLLVNISNDAWFGQTSAPEQHLQLSALRAVEQGKPLARGTNTGISALVDARGAIVVRGGLFVAEALEFRVTAQTERTVYFYLAPFLPYLLLGCMGILLLRRRFC